MSELRQDVTTKEWVIIATERAKRPEDFSLRTCELKNQNAANCPFCPGHEKMTPEAIVCRDKMFDSCTSNWQLRVVPNKFAALSLGGSLERKKENDLMVKIDGLGVHEVIIETPDHHQTIAAMKPEDVELIFLTYRERYLALSQEPLFKMIIIFKNQGCSAGTSLSHSHSQLIATPVVPKNIRHTVEEAMRHFDEDETCLYCDLVKTERQAKKRIVFETEDFMVFEPFASRSPFETWVIPKKHMANFKSISGKECRELANTMRTTLIKINKALGNPDYNYILYSSPCHDDNLEYYHWHIKIFPRVTQIAGFEMGSGIYINPVVPEEAARFIREAAA